MLRTEAPRTWLARPRTWSICCTILAAPSSETPVEAAQRFVADLLSSKLIIAVSKIDGGVRDIWITDEPMAELRFCPAGEVIMFRLWDGTRFEALK